MPGTIGIQGQENILAALPEHRTVSAQVPAVLLGKSRLTPGSGRLGRVWWCWFEYTGGLVDF